jgi:hypothetical protein
MEWHPAESVQCVFSGDVVVTVEGHFVEAVGIVCKVPKKNSRVAGALSIMILVDGQDVSQGSELTFEYEAPAVVAGIIPSAGALEGSTLVQVLGSGFQAGPGLSCLFALAASDGAGSGRVMIQGRWESSSMMVCESPRVGSEQTVSVEVSNNGADLTSSGVQFVYEPAPTVDQVGLAEMGRGSGGGLVLRVTGKHFVQSSGLRCKMGVSSDRIHALSGARYVSSSMVYCRVEDRHGT